MASFLTSQSKDRLRVGDTYPGTGCTHGVRQKRDVRNKFNQKSNIKKGDFTSSDETNLLFDEINQLKYQLYQTQQRLEQANSRQSVNQQCFSYNNDKINQQRRYNRNNNNNNNNNTQFNRNNMGLDGNDRLYTRSQY